DAVARIHRAGALRAEVGVPALAAGGARGLRAQLTDLVRALEATEVGALAGAGAGDEEAHSALLGLSSCRSAEQEQRDRCHDGKSQSVLHVILLGCFSSCSPLDAAGTCKWWWRRTSVQDSEPSSGSSACSVSRGSAASRDRRPRGNCRACRPCQRRPAACPC